MTPRASNAFANASTPALLNQFHGIHPTRTAIVFRFRDAIDRKGAAIVRSHSSALSARFRQRSQCLARYAAIVLPPDADATVRTLSSRPSS